MPQVTLAEFPEIAAFEEPDHDRPLMLRRLPNGGWVVSQKSDAMSYPVELGAYRDAAGMLSALSCLMAPERTIS